jgi:hypothetical protein
MGSTLRVGKIYNSIFNIFLYFNVCCLGVLKKLSNLNTTIADAVKIVYLVTQSGVPTINFYNLSALGFEPRTCGLKVQCSTN